MRYFTFRLSEHLICLLENMFYLSLIVADFEAYLLILLCHRVDHPDLEFPICGMRVIPLLSYGSYDLFALMHFGDANLHQILLIHLNQIYSCHMVLFYYLLDF